MMLLPCQSHKTKGRVSDATTQNNLARAAVAVARCAGCVEEKVMPEFWPVYLFIASIVASLALFEIASAWWFRKRS